MSYTVTKLITDAFYISGIVARDFETVSGSQFNDALNELNLLLDDKTVDTSMIPYYTRLDFNTVVGQEEYLIDDLIQVDTMVFFLDTVRYSMVQYQRVQYFGSPRADNIESLMWTYHVEKCFGGANVFLYFKPDQIYDVQLWGQFRLTEVTNNQDLALTLDGFYRDYLRFELAERLCMIFSYDVPPFVQQQVKRFRQYISKKSGVMDLSVRKISTLTYNPGINYAQVNIGKGWSAPNG